MWFLTKVWVPWWLYFAVIQFSGINKGPLDQAAGAGIILIGWLGVNVLVTIVYIATRVFRRATRESAPPQ